MNMEKRNLRSDSVALPVAGKLLHLLDSEAARTMNSGIKLFSLRSLGFLYYSSVLKKQKYQPIHP